MKPLDDLSQGYLLSREDLLFLYLYSLNTQYKRL